MTDFPDDTAICDLAETLVKPYETFRAKPYLCPAGKPTIGYGTRWYPDGTAVTLADPAISEARACACLRHALMVTWRQLKALLTRAPTLNQAAAMLDLAYTAGVGVHDGKKGDIADSDLLAAFNRGDSVRVASEFPLWNKAHVHGKLVALPGLTRRRLAERALYFK